MPDMLATYLHDHLAGARFAVSLLAELAAQDDDSRVKSLAAHLVREVESDRQVLGTVATRTGADTSPVKELAAWLAQKAGRFKLALDEPLGRFEAVELLCLGVQGKLALWTALETAPETRCQLAGPTLDELKRRATEQHQQLESLRLTLAAELFRQNVDATG